MFTKLAVLLTSVGLILMIIMIFRQRSEQISKQNYKEEFPEKRPDWIDFLNDLSLDELEEKLRNLEQLKISASSDFVNMNSAQKHSSMKTVSNINEKIEKVNQAISERKQWNSDRY